MKFLYLTNIPTPYRIARFNLLSRALLELGVDLEVLFMAEIEPDRNWEIDYDKISFKYKIYKGIHPTIGRIYAHFNPGLLLRLRRRDYEAIVIGGMASPTHLLATFFARDRAIKIMSVESNLDSTKITSGLGAAVKRTVLDACDVYQVTGERQIRFIDFFSSKNNKKILRLPNLIDEKLFSPARREEDGVRTEIRRTMALRKEEQMWVLPARLSEEKGVIEFLRAIRGKTGFMLLILGAGPLKQRIEELIRDETLPARLVGFVQAPEVARYYAAADAFVLPSLRDPSPLSVIEAIRTGLPLLISSRLGNADEVCDERNGFLFDPENPESIEGAIDGMRTKSNDALELMRVSSLERYASIFDAKMNIERYAKQITEMIALGANELRSGN